MQPTVNDKTSMKTLEDWPSRKTNVIEFKLEHTQSEGISDNSADEIEAWARHSLATNGFSGI